MNATANNIVFDWNGTLLEDTAAVHDCLNLILERAGHSSIDIETYRDRYEVPFEQFYKNFGLSDDEIEALGLNQNHLFHDHYDHSHILAEIC